ncbi:MAG: hypothetical protein ABIQ59_11575 [Nocardioidaceae bacterium]
MDLSGIIFVVLAVAWAVYLIPKALRHHDEVARTRSIDRFSTAMRVLARREPVNRRDARLVVTPARGAGNPRVLAPTRAAVDETPVPVSVTVQPAVSKARLAARRTAARAAARRRRHILTFLLLGTAVTAAVAAFALVPWWSVAIPGGLTLAYLLLCRTQVRRESMHDFDLLADRPAHDGEDTVVPRRAIRVEAQDGTPRSMASPMTAEVTAHVDVRVDADGVSEFDDAEDTVGIEVALLEAIVIPTEDGGSLWDPLPVTLPTYVTKPKAQRTVRTIDLGEPGTWTSGRTAEDTQIVAQAAAAEAETKAGKDGEQQRAVGS